MTFKQEVPSAAHRRTTFTFTIVWLVCFATATWGCTQRGLCTSVPSGTTTGVLFASLTCYNSTSGLCSGDSVPCASGLTQLCALETTCANSNEFSRSQCLLLVGSGNILTAGCMLDSNPAGACFTLTVNDNEADNRNCIDPSTGSQFEGVSKLCDLPLPTTAPTAPTASPTFTPTAGPSASPSRAPTAPTAAPTAAPTVTPTAPTAIPTAAPVAVPTETPSASPSASPSGTPSAAPTAPTAVPTTSPVATPTGAPTVSPTGAPTDVPTSAPTAPTAIPTDAPTTATPSTSPSAAPTRGCQLCTTASQCGIEGLERCACQYTSGSRNGQCTTLVPGTTLCFPDTTRCELLVPTNHPTATPSTATPTAVPTTEPTPAPSEMPTLFPTTNPTSTPTIQTCPGDSTLSNHPNCVGRGINQCVESELVRILCPILCHTCPTPAPTSSPTATPTTLTAAPTHTPTAFPSNTPTASPTSAPTTLDPTSAPTQSPTANPSQHPTPACAVGGPDHGSCFNLVQLDPLACLDNAIRRACPANCNACTDAPTAVPSKSPSAAPTASPTASPNAAPTAAPSATPTLAPTAAPTDSPSSRPTVSPSAVPTAAPSATPTLVPTATPSASPSLNPTSSPTALPTRTPTANPTTLPTLQPTLYPTPVCVYGSDPSGCRDLVLSLGCDSITSLRCPAACNACTDAPTSAPTTLPTATPTRSPTESPSGHPTTAPTTRPSEVPTTSPTGAPTDECGLILCSTDCQGPLHPECGWSSPHSMCIRGADTHPAELGLGYCPPTTAAPVTHAPTSIPTTANPTTASPTATPTASPVASYSCAATGACLGGVEAVRQYSNGTTCYCVPGCSSFGVCCPDYDAICNPTTSPTSSPTPCSAVTCSDDCTGGCGWSVNKNSCIVGGRTTASESGLGPGCTLGVTTEQAAVSAPTSAGTSSPTTTSAPTPCASVTCSDDCTGGCGWSSNRNICVAGGRTTASESGLGPGCTTTSRAPVASVAPTPAGMPTTSAPTPCVLVMCSNDCTGGCGWSSNKNSCIAGGHTTTSELGLGDCGGTSQSPVSAAPTTTNPPSSVACDTITCSDECTGECGWSSGYNMCKPGATTTSSEVGLGPGCNATTTRSPTTSPPTSP